MSQLTFGVDALEFNVNSVEIGEFVFLDDSSYQLIGGGDAVNGY